MIICQDAASGPTHSCLKFWHELAPLIVTWSSFGDQKAELQNTMAAINAKLQPGTTQVNPAFGHNKSSSCCGLQAAPHWMLSPSVTVQAAVRFLSFCLNLCQWFSILLWTVGGGVCTMFVVEFIPCLICFFCFLLLVLFFFSLLCCII